LTKGLDREFEALWQKYIRMREQHAHYSAFVYLGEMANCLRYAKLSSEARLKWRQRLQQPELTQAIIESIEIEALQDFEHLRRIVGNGALVFEEAVVVIGHGVRLEALLSYLAERGVSIALDAGLVDALLQIVDSEPENFSVYQSARQAVRRNSVPIQSRWLSNMTH